MDKHQSFPTSKTVLGLHLATDPRWADLAAIRLEDILTDHAYCEQKAATSCISLIQSYPEKEALVAELSPVVTEEWGHFRMVLAQLKKRGMTLGRQRKDEYVNHLLSFQIKGGSATDRLLEKLLTCALIEARSCERFRILSKEIEDETLKEFYWQLMIAEAGHYRLFLDLAKRYINPDRVMKRWQEYLDYETEMIQTLTLRGDRMH